ncbi:MAG: MotA/TolQ/ExbB proton channel family protein [Leptospiraceae bacterium]|nr:MotA/TolQ/ExbB proton channel family protein [Leptospiraceae bacterium]
MRRATLVNRPLSHEKEKKLNTTFRKYHLYAIFFLCLLSIAPAVAIWAQPVEQPTGAEETAPADNTENESAADSEDAAPDDMAADENPGDESIFEVIYKGGWTMVGLGLISTIIIAFSLERLFYFRRQKVDTRGFFEWLLEKMRSGNVDSLEQELQQDDRLIARVLSYGLEHRKEGGARFESTVEKNATVEISKLERGLNLLANLGNLAPLLGFFGTVVGMRESFLEFVIKEAPTARDLAGGVETALITTAAGLLIAIPTYLIYNLFIYYIDNFTMEVERSGELLRDSIDRPESTAKRAVAKSGGRRKASGSGNSKAD